MHEFSRNILQHDFSKNILRSENIPGNPVEILLE